MFIRRIFYNTTTLEILHVYHMQGSILPRPPWQEEAVTLGLENSACMEWTTPDPEIEAQFATHNTVEVEVVDGAPVLVFSNVEEPEPEDPYAALADAQAALALLDIYPEEVPDNE